MRALAASGANQIYSASSKLLMRTLRQKHTNLDYSLNSGSRVWRVTASESRGCKFFKDAELSEASAIEGSFPRCCRGFRIWVLFSLSRTACMDIRGRYMDGKAQTPGW